MSWINKILPPSIRTSTAKKKGVPEGLWTKCPECASVLFKAELERNLEVCPKCNHHMRLSARKRLSQFLDSEPTYQEIAAELEPVDRLKFKDSKKYKDRLSSAQKNTNEKDALVVAKGHLFGVPVVCAAFEFGFIGGSMGTVVGERFVQAVDQAIQANAPLICFSTSGGARMQEGLFSLMQMARTSAALTHLKDKKLPFISVMIDPMMGGVSASFALLGDVHIAEPKALIGFAGPRVIEQTVRETLPEGFQRAEFLVDHGFVDMVVERKDMRATISRLISNLMQLPKVS